MIYTFLYKSSNMNLLVIHTSEHFFWVKITFKVLNMLPDLLLYFDTQVLTLFICKPHHILSNFDIRNPISLSSSIYYFIVGLLSKSLIHIKTTGLVFLSHTSFSISSRLKFYVTFLTVAFLSESRHFIHCFKTT